MAKGSIVQCNGQELSSWPGGNRISVSSLIVVDVIEMSGQMEAQVCLSCELPDLLQFGHPPRVISCLSTGVPRSAGEDEKPSTEQKNLGAGISLAIRIVLVPIDFTAHVSQQQ